MYKAINIEERDSEIFEAESWEDFIKSVKRLKMGLNITNLKKKTKLSNTSITKALSSLMTAKIIDMEEVGNSKVYHLKRDK